MKDDVFPEWASYFSEIGLITSPDNIKNLIMDSIRYFISILRIEPEKMCLRVSLRDKDLLKYAKQTLLELKTDAIY